MTFSVKNELGNILILIGLFNTAALPVIVASEQIFCPMFVIGYLMGDISMLFLFAGLYIRRQAIFKIIGRVKT